MHTRGQSHKKKVTQCHYTDAFPTLPINLLSWSPVPDALALRPFVKATVLVYESENLENQSCDCSTIGKPRAHCSHCKNKGKYLHRCNITFFHPPSFCRLSPTHTSLESLSQ
ncbi:hypothetical protein LENED_007109 [Lentinula edodes]|uniref:Uncharacterized protein n=1 Tax=Lentinula edodes TaxID=5353 RepID=A0A1Q3EDH9_LENED|nr:hypothetical protein LENED_007109 [Lentinula edodes]